jgi:hypothetical protein
MTNLEQEIELTFAQQQELTKILELYRSNPSNSNKYRFQLFAQINEYLQSLLAAAREDFATKIMLTPSEGLFDDGDLFVKRAPIEQTIISEIGYEKFKAIQEAANAKEEARKRSIQETGDSK